MTNLFDLSGSFARGPLASLAISMPSGRVRWPRSCMT